MNSLTSTQRENCAILAELLEEVPKQSFDMSTWARNNYCGTVGCALGWAAMSDRIPRLQYCAYRFDGYDKNFVDNVDDLGKADFFSPVIDGKLSDWGEAAETLFGEYTHIRIFLGQFTQRDTVIQKLIALSKGEFV